MQLTNASYLKLALPFILAAITTPLLGAVGTAVVGRLDNVNYISAVALGAVIVSTMYWLFGFLRLITSSLSSQALGRGDAQGAAVVLLQPYLLALVIGLLLVAGQQGIWRAAMWILNPDAELRVLCKIYFDILIWAAPLVLGSYVLNGWLMGRMRMKAVVALQVGTNLANCLLCFLMVDCFGLNVDGVAMAILISQTGSFFVALLLVARIIRQGPLNGLWGKVFQRQGFSDLFSTNFYLFIRTLCMLVMVNTFMASSAAFGGEIMAANAILFQLQYVMGDIFDGLSSASSVYSGLAVGSPNRDLFYANLRYSGIWAAVFALVISLAYYLLQTPILALFTDKQGVLEIATEYSIYIVIFPPIAAAGIVYYGIFNGALKTRLVCVSMLLTIAAYLPALYIFTPLWSNHGLWLAYIVFYVGRSGFLLLLLPRLIRRFDFLKRAS